MKNIFQTIAFLLFIICFSTNNVLAGYIFISNEGSDNITVIDLDTYKILANIESGKRPRDMKIIPEKNQLLVAASEDDRINIINYKSNIIFW